MLLSTHSYINNLSRKLNQQILNIKSNDESGNQINEKVYNEKNIKKTSILNRKGTMSSIKNEK